MSKSGNIPYYRLDEILFGVRASGLFFILMGIICFIAGILLQALSNANDMTFPIAASALVVVGLINMFLLPLMFKTH